MSTYPGELPCGADVMALVDQVYDGAPPENPEHQRTCPYCQEAISRLRAALGQLRDLAGETIRPPRGLSGRVLEQLRRERETVVIAEGPLGRDTVNEIIIAQVARRAALCVPGVRYASCVAELADSGAVDLEVNVTAELGPSLPSLADAVRALVLTHTAALIGARLGRIDVTVDDIG